MSGLLLALAIGLGVSQGVAWPAGGWRVVHQQESDGRFNATQVASWEQVVQRWQVGAPAPDGRIPVQVQGLTGHKRAVGEGPDGPFSQQTRLEAGPAADAAALWWQISGRAPKALWLSPDGQRVVDARWVEGAAAVKARFLDAGGDPEALPPGLDTVLAEAVDPERLTRLLPQVGADGRVTRRAVPSLMGATLHQTLWHRRGDGPEGTVDAFDGEGTLTGSTALFWMVAVQMNRIHGHSALDAQGRPQARVERLEVAGRVLRPPDKRGPGEAPYGPLRFDILTETTWAPEPTPAP
ncbi:MAG: hypothetical protein KC613_06960 [Myxococcales bacterium]|nr:hypothetical protein [Myxococcales bacterium]MCB9523025.1 hypothetical protein [Myxococcales bacterium]